MERREEQQGGVALYTSPVERRAWEMQQENAGCSQRMELGLGGWGEQLKDLQAEAATLGVQTPSHVEVKDTAPQSSPPLTFPRDHQDQSEAGIF